MAKILISYFSDYGEAMYDAITDTLLKNENSIFRFNINNTKVSITKWGGCSTIVDNNLMQQIKAFAPEIVFNFNNCLPVNCFDLLPDNCRICAIDADAPEVAFWNKDNLKKYYNKYVFLGLQSYSKKMYERYLGKRLSNNYIYFPPATVVKKECLPQDKNISFIGSNFYPDWIPDFSTDFYKPEALKLYEQISLDYFLSNEDAKKFCPNIGNINWLIDFVRGYNAGQQRLKFLQQLTDLGLTIYGSRGWNHIAYYDLELAKCFDSKNISSIEENAWVYNTSKISVNISHPLAKSSFSWRVMDIMASGSCLLTEDKPDWRELFEKYLSKEVLETVIYKDRFDMREKAIKLLNNEKLRIKCVKELNNAIEQNGRWESRFKMLSEFLNVPLLNVSTNNGNLIFIPREDVCTVQKESCIEQQELCIRKSHFRKLIQKLRTFLYRYERFSKMVKESQFSGFIILCISALIPLYKLNLSLLGSISESLLYLIIFGISFAGVAILAIAYLYKPIRFFLRITKKTLKKILGK